MKTKAAALALFALIFFTFQQAQAGVITITDRESKGSNVLFAGSGGAVDQRDMNDDLVNLTGAFSFSDSGNVAVTESQPFSLGAASAFGSISVTDNVTQASPDTLVLTATRTASATANSTAGTGNGNSTQNQTFRVRFTTGADPVNYSLTGNFDPGATAGIIGENGRITLNRPFTANTPISITSAIVGINEVGTLPANRTYELLVRMTDKTSANAGNPFASDASSLDITFTLQSIPVPEPSTAAMFAVTSLILILRRKVPSGHIAPQ